MDIIAFPKTENPEVIVIPPPEENDEKVAVVSHVENVVPIENAAGLAKMTDMKMVYAAIPIRGESTKVSKEQAVMGLQDGTHKRIAVTCGKGKSATIDRFTCEPYAPFQVFDTKVHHVGGCQSAMEAVELAEMSAAIEGE